MTGERPDPGEQLVEWVDDEGKVIDVVTRSRMRAENLRHRSVYVLVLDESPSGSNIEGLAVMTHKRADWKDVFPGAWDLAFGGVCDPGETWRQAAVRELAEEAGVVVSETDLVDHGPVGYFSPEEVSLIARVFSVRYGGEFKPADGEVVALRWLPVDAVDAFVAEAAIPQDSRAILVDMLRDLDINGAII